MAELNKPTSVEEEDDDSSVASSPFDDGGFSDSLDSVGGAASDGQESSSATVSAVVEGHPFSPGAAVAATAATEATTAPDEEDNQCVSTRLGKLWRSLSAAAKESYRRKVAIAAAIHRIKYPGYVYNPREAHQRKEQEHIAKAIVSKVKQEPSEDQELEAQSTSASLGPSAAVLQPLPRPPQSPSPLPLRLRRWATTATLASTQADGRATQTGRSTAAAPSTPSARPVARPYCVRSRRRFTEAATSSAVEATLCSPATTQATQHQDMGGLFQPCELAVSHAITFLPYAYSTQVCCTGTGAQPCNALRGPYSGRGGGSILTETPTSFQEAETRGSNRPPLSGRAVDRSVFFTSYCLYYPLECGFYAFPAFLTLKLNMEKFVGRSKGA
ncbi:hypothetical protein MRX96_048448 [Rhipicephalus microplus]